MALEDSLTFPVTTHVFIRDTFTLTLWLDEESGHFSCSCKPPHQMEQEEVRKAAYAWTKHIAYGWSRRNNGSARNQVHVDLRQEHYGWFGTIIADH